MSQIIIIEDEKPAARRLQRMLQKENIQAGVLLHSVNESIQWLSKHPAPSLIFADIQLSDGLSFEIFEKIPVKSPVIFTTAYDQYAIKAFKLNSIDYLLKPIRQEELQQALSKYQTQKYNIPPDIQQLIHDLQESSRYKTRFLVQYGHYLKSIQTPEISFFYSQDKTTYLVTQKGEEFIIDNTLEQVENWLNPKDFFRVNRQYIIRHICINDIVTYSNSRLKIILKAPHKQEIIVARERVKNFKNWLN